MLKRFFLEKGGCLFTIVVLLTLGGCGSKCDEEALKAKQEPASPHPFLLHGTEVQRAQGDSAFATGFHQL